MNIPPDVIDAMQHAYDKADCGLTDAESPMHAALSVAQEYIATALRAAAAEGARAPMGCICPPTSEKTCLNPFCPRRSAFPVPGLKQP